MGALANQGKKPPVRNHRCTLEAREADKRPLGHFGQDSQTYDSGQDGRRDRATIRHRDSCRELPRVVALLPRVICRIDLYEIKARLRRANSLRAALRAVLGCPKGCDAGAQPMPPGVIVRLIVHSVSLRLRRISSFLQQIRQDTL
jgi:hypothetical protein